MKAAWVKRVFFFALRVYFVIYFVLLIYADINETVFPTPTKSGAKIGDHITTNEGIISAVHSPTRGLANAAPPISYVVLVTQPNTSPGRYVHQQQLRSQAQQYDATGMFISAWAQRTLQRADRDDGPWASTFPKSVVTEHFGGLDKGVQGAGYETLLLR